MEFLGTLLILAMMKRQRDVEDVNSKTISIVPPKKSESFPQDHCVPFCTIIFAFSLVSK